MDEEQDSIEALREGMLSSMGSMIAAQLSIEARLESMRSSLGSMIATQRDGTEDFNAMESELVTQIREWIHYRSVAGDRHFGDMLTVATLERKRQIRNARALDRFADTAKGEGFWR